MNKKAISPLIATVLLIGFTVIIAAAVWMWYGNLLTEQMEKQGAVDRIKTDCATQIELSVLDASSTGSDINIEIKNIGKDIFNGVRVIVYKNDQSESLTEKEIFNVGEQKSLTFTTSILSANKIDVMPMIVRQGIPGTCADKKVSAEL